MAPYHPVFLDGWSPDYPVTDDRDHVSPTAGTTAVAAEVSRTRGDEVRWISPAGKG